MKESQHTIPQVDEGQIKEQLIKSIREKVKETGLIYNAKLLLKQKYKKEKLEELTVQELIEFSQKFMEGWKYEDESELPF